MQLRKTILASLALLLAAGTGVFAATASSGAKSAATKASSAARKASASKSAASKRSRHSRRRERGQKAPTADRITEIQQALAQDGSFSGKPNGKWDASTVEAMRKFQEAHGLNPTGKLDALTLQKLGLGSQTAGVAAPLPPVSSSLNSPSGANASTAASTAQSAHPEQ
jgi:peptidoglycan hydrolase-like protein with peptidoglycan-binding domain